MNPADADALGLADSDVVVLRNGAGELTIRVRLTEAVQPRMLYVPLGYDGGAVTALFGDDSTVTWVQVALASR